MNKLNIRSYKSHYGQRWSVFRYNQKHRDKVLLVEDKITLSHIDAGKNSCFVDCLGDTYKHLPCVSIDLDRVYDNLIFINNIEFKYCNVQQLVNKFKKYIEFLDTGGTMVIWLDIYYLIFDRVNCTVDDLANQFIECLKDIGLVNKKYLNLVNKSDRGFGNLFFVFNKL